MTYILTFLCCLSAHAANVTLAWDASPDTNVCGYLLCYGTKSGNYTVTNTVNAQMLSNRVEGLTEGQTYYFAVQAFDANGLTSDYSNEVTWTGQANLQVRRKIKMRVRL